MTSRAERFRTDVTMMLRARFPIIAVETFEEHRVLDSVRTILSDPELIRTPRPLHIWTATRGFVGPDGDSASNTADPASALDWVLHQQDPGVFVMHDLHQFLGDRRRPAEPSLIRALRDLASSFSQGINARSLILISPHFTVPPDLEKDVVVLDFPLPDEPELRAALDEMVAANAGGNIRIDLDEDGYERLVKAALGLTANEANNAFARAMADDGILNVDDVRIVLDEKRQTVRKSGLLEFVDSKIDLDDVGGLQNLKRWLAKRNGSWLGEATDYGLPAPRGLLMTGVPGCGKSLTAKAIAAAWELPLLRMDIGKVFAGLVGSSEQNMRSAIQAAEATAPCVLWVDEIEKGFAPTNSSGDSGTSSRVFGSFLTWMQEKQAPVFVVATANRVEQLPPELLRKGRFDEIFFVDLPTAPERADIWRVHLDRGLANSKAAGLAISDELVAGLVAASEGYTGAEIEQAVIAGLFDAFADRRTLTEADLRRAIESMIPLAVTQAEQIEAVRAWAATRAVAATSEQDRTGYAATQPLAETAPSGDDHSPDNTDSTRTRGGRIIEF
ncbi:AAA family ATPase [Gordonia crocea]|uniref:Uncharacterized AAA domain-containing protein ycf46 n=1 Tax=Gordonia crocea TaxID=589162 RepID=A0A7I9UYZ3_9ACTN|nr:AAA family ATPase [Gordonia crocea]GED98020.1 ATPase [Gordonia crocea]